MLHVSVETFTRDLLSAFAGEAVIKLDLTSVLSINRPWNGRNLQPFDHGSHKEKDTVSQHRQR